MFKVCGEVCLGFPPWSQSCRRSIYRTGRLASDTAHDAAHARAPRDTSSHSPKHNPTIVQSIAARRASSTEGFHGRAQMSGFPPLLPQLMSLRHLPALRQRDSSRPTAPHGGHGHHNLPHPPPAFIAWASSHPSSRGLEVPDKRRTHTASIVVSGACATNDASVANHHRLGPAPPSIALGAARPQASRTTPTNSSSRPLIRHGCGNQPAWGTATPVG